MAVKSIFTWMAVGPTKSVQEDTLCHFMTDVAGGAIAFLTTQQFIRLNNCSDHPLLVWLC